MMRKFKDLREEFNYYVLKSVFYKKKGDLVNSNKYFEKATEVKKKLDQQTKDKR